MISIITSLYKSEIFLPDYIKNIQDFYSDLKNKGVSIELIIIANDISEKEKNILSSLIKTNWVRIIEIPRESLYSSWNRGIRESKFPVCTFWNVDDIRFSNAIIDGLKKIEEGKELIYFPFRYKRYIKIFNFKILAKNTIINPPEFERETFSKGMNCGPFFMFTKKLYEKVGPFDESFKIAGDFDWCVRAAQVTNFDLSREIAGIFTNEGTSLSGSKGNILQEENNRIYQKNGILNKIKPI